MSRTSIFRAITVAIFLVTISLSPASISSAGADDKVMVFAAASLTDALTKIGQSYEADTGKKVTLSFAASSALARQIESSPAADMFISADQEWMDYLAQRGLIKGDTRTNLLGNKLVLIAPASSKISLSISPGFPLMSALNGGRLAIADPESVPAGKYARTALTSLGVWGEVADHLAQADNVRVALAFVAREETPLGIVYMTDALAQPKVRVVDTFPENSHPSITYPVALTKVADSGAEEFLAYLKSPKAKTIFDKAGFTFFP